MAKYYDNELVAHDAAREASKECTHAIYVNETSSGFYISSLGQIGASYYMCGKHESEINEDDTQEL